MSEDMKKKYEADYNPETGEVTLGGIPVEEKPQSECEEATFVVCMRCDEGPPGIPSAIRQRCCECDAEVWFDHLTSPKIPEKICGQCVMERIKNLPEGEKPQFIRRENNPFVDMYETVSKIFGGGKR